MNNGGFDDMMGFKNARKRSVTARVSPIVRQQMDEIKIYMWTNQGRKISDYDASEILIKDYKRFKRNEKIWGF